MRTNFIISRSGSPFESGHLSQTQRADDYDSALALYKEACASEMKWTQVSLTQYNLTEEQTIAWCGDGRKKYPHIDAPQTTCAEIRLFRRLRSGRDIEAIVNVGAQFGSPECNCFAFSYLWTYYYEDEAGNRIL